MYEVRLTERSQKELDKLPKDISKNIFIRISLLTFPFPSGLNISKLSGLRDYYRLRVGKIRVIFVVFHETKKIIIRKIAYRKDVYRFS